MVFKKGRFLRAVPFLRKYSNRKLIIFSYQVYSKLSIALLTTEIFVKTEILKMVATPEVLVAVVVLVVVILLMATALAKTLYIEYEVEEDGKKGRKSRLVFGNKRLK